MRVTRNMKDGFCELVTAEIVCRPHIHYHSDVEKKLVREKLSSTSPTKQEILIDISNG